MIFTISTCLPNPHPLSSQVVCLSVYPSLYLSVCLSIWQWYLQFPCVFHIFILYLLRFSLYQSVCLCVCLSVCLQWYFPFPCVFHIFILYLLRLSLYQSVCESVCQSDSDIFHFHVSSNSSSFISSGCPSISLFISLSVCLCVCVCLIVCLPSLCLSDSNIYHFHVSSKSSSSISSGCPSISLSAWSLYDTRGICIQYCWNLKYIFKIVDQIYIPTRASIWKIPRYILFELYQHYMYFACLESVVRFNLRWDFYSVRHIDITSASFKWSPFKWEQWRSGDLNLDHYIQKYVVAWAIVNKFHYYAMCLNNFVCTITHPYYCCFSFWYN